MQMFQTILFFNSKIISNHFVPLQWHHNERDSISNHRYLDGLLSPLFRRRSKKILMLRVTGLCEGYSLVTGEFPSQRASNSENVSIWWCHHAIHENPQNSSMLKVHLWHEFQYILIAENRLLWYMNRTPFQTTTSWNQLHSVIDIMCRSVAIYNVPIMLQLPLFGTVQYSSHITTMFATYKYTSEISIMVHVWCNFPCFAMNISLP